jgi:hypothetical protein
MYWKTHSPLVAAIVRDYVGTPPCLGGEGEGGASSGFCFGCPCIKCDCYARILKILGDKNMFYCYAKQLTLEFKWLLDFSDHNELETYRLKGLIEIKKTLSITE